MNPHDLLQRHRKEPKRVATLQIRLPGKGQFLHIIHRFDIIRTNACLLQHLPVERYFFCLLNGPPEPFCLKGVQSITFQGLHLSIPVFHSDNQLIVQDTMYSRIARPDSVYLKRRSSTLNSHII